MTAPLATIDEARNFATAMSPVRWARLDASGRSAGIRLFGKMGLATARAISPAAPPTLILSMPRSGSSWVGEVLGQAENALYLREPVSQGYLLLVDGDTVFEIDPAAPPASYQAFADLAFAGIPQFPQRIVPFPAQWTLGSRRHRRLVIKEVNPLACAWYCMRYDPFVVLLVRHPAAVASSYISMGWTNDDPDALERFGRHYGDAHSHILCSLQGRRDHLIVSYEELCLAPRAGFQTLFERTGLRWTPEMADHVAGRTSGADDGQPYGTSRDSRQMVDVWRQRLTSIQVAAVRHGYRTVGLPWYDSDDAW